MGEENAPGSFNGYNIGTILKRLEAATSRLEDISVYQEDLKWNKRDTLADLKADARNLAILPPSSQPKPAITTTLFVTAYERLIETQVKPFIALSMGIDPILESITTPFHAAFNAQLQFLDLVSRSQKPSDESILATALAPLTSAIQLLVSAADKLRDSDFKNHANTLSEGIPALGWVVSPTSVLFIAEYKDLTLFWLNRILSEFKGKDPKMKEWVSLFNTLFDHLKNYVKEYHSTGPAWNAAHGVPLSQALQSKKDPTGSSSSGTAASPPPPPPPPPASIFNDTDPQTSSGGMSSVFADLNKGESVTAGLRKVEKLEMTHKNPSLRDKPTPPKKPTNLAKPTVKPSVARPPRTELVDGTKWIVEHHVDTTLPIVIEAEMHQLVFIGHCNGTTIQVNGKANAILILETVRIGLVVDSLISGIDLIKSHKFGVQVLGVVPTINVDQCDEGQIYLLQQSVDGGTQTYTSCSTGLNMNAPSEGKSEGEDEFKEHAVPEQFKHSFKDGKLVSEIVEHAG